MCQKSIYIINLFCLEEKKKAKREIQRGAIELRNGKLFLFPVFLQFMVQFYFFPFLKIIQNRAYKLFSW